MGLGNRYNLISISRYSVYGYEYDRQRDSSKDTRRMGRGEGLWSVISFFYCLLHKMFYAR